MPTPLPTGTGGLTCDSRSIPTVGSRGCAYTARWSWIRGSSTGPWTCWPRKTVAGWSAARMRSMPLRRTSSFPAGPATWGKAGRIRADAAAATTLRCSPLPQPDAHPRHVEIDTSYYMGNAPGWVRLSAIDARSADIDDDSAWTELLPRTAVQPTPGTRSYWTRPARPHIYGSTS